jgi:undecaprenyl-diphosphatase
MSPTLALKRLALADERALRWCHRHGERTAILKLFAAISRIGDGAIWWLLILSWPLHAGAGGMHEATVLAATALTSVSLYALLKRRLKRPRPAMRLSDLKARIYTLDEFSFPSGHTMNALSISAVAIAFTPACAVVLLPLCALIAASRVVLGVHYPSDVLAGIALGLSVASVVLACAGLPFNR